MEVVCLRKGNGVTCFVPTLQSATQNIISLCLAALNCWDDFVLHHALLVSRRGVAERDVKVPKLRAKVTRAVAESHRRRAEKQERFWYEKFQGYVSAAQGYPYEDEDVNRAQRSFLQKINQDLFQSDADGPATLSSMCEARLAPKRQGLGVFATRDIKKSDLIYYEEPTIRGNLPPRRMVQDKSSSDEDHPRCENCQRVIGIQANIPKIKTAINVRTDSSFCKCFEFWTRRPGTPGLAFCQASDKSDKTCLQIARELYHFSSCGKDWTWLYDAMRPNISEFLGKEHISRSNEVHGTILSLLLRNVFEITLHRRKDDPNLMAHELDELLVLDGDSKSWRESWFPFSMAANVIVPFDILTYLGVDIFRDLTFDTWVIQIILRKLLTNVVPWDQQCQGRVSVIQTHDQGNAAEHRDEQEQRIKSTEPFTHWDPSFKNLYLFPGFSMFNHSCRGAHNADWGYDQQIPNRVLVWAVSDIKKGDEVRLRYQHGKIGFRNCGIRLFGTSCQCPQCSANPKKKNRPPRPQEPEGESETEQTIILITDESTQNSEQESQPVQTPKKRKRSEQLIVDNCRVVIHRSLFDEEEFQQAKRKRQKKLPQFLPSGSREPRRPPLTGRRSGETQKAWIEREKAAVRAARKAANGKSTSKGKNRKN